MKKRKIVASSIIVSVLLVGIIASSYAYFKAVVSSGSTSAVNVSAKTLDSLVFSNCADLSIIANQDNFGLGKGDLTATSTCTVKLTANNNSSASYGYVVNLTDGVNTFENSITCDSAYSNGGTKSANLIPCDSSKWGTFGSTNGIDYEYNSDGSITLNGKVTGTFASIPIPILTNSTGKLSLSNMTYYNPTLSSYPTVAFLEATTSAGRTITFGNSTNIVLQDLGEYITTMNLVVYSASGTLDNVKVYPMITTSSSATSYVAPGYSLASLVVSATRNGKNVVNEQDLNVGEVTSGSMYRQSQQLATATISAEAGKTTVDTWVIVVKLKNYNFDQTIYAGSLTRGVSFSRIS